MLHVLDVLDNKGYKHSCFLLFHFNSGYSKVKCTPVQALRLCTGRMAHRGSRGIALLFLDDSTRRGWGVSVMPRPLFTPGKDPVPIVQEAGWAPGPVWTGAENFAPIGIWSPDRPAHSQSLYRLSYQASGYSNMAQYCIYTYMRVLYFHIFFTHDKQVSCLYYLAGLWQSRVCV
jgi:hypothetical protein